MEKPELKPCPFCGGRAAYESFYEMKFRVICHPENDCQVDHPKTKWFDDRETAAEVWNRRAGEEAGNGE